MFFAYLLILNFCLIVYTNKVYKNQSVTKRHIKVFQIEKISSFSENWLNESGFVKVDPVYTGFIVSIKMSNH